MKKAWLLAPVAVALVSYSLLPSAYYKGKALLVKENKDKKIIYLTFDDGPSIYTPRLLDLLKHYDIKATFFVVGSFAKNHPSVIARMQKEGHCIGVHSLCHKNGLWQRPKSTAEDMQKTHEILSRCGVNVHYFRPPWGHFNIQTLKSMKKHGYTAVMWQVMAEDWRGNTTSEMIAKKLTKRTKSGNILCLHDGRGKNQAPLRTIEALEQVLPKWKKAGYRFLTLDEKI